MEICRFPANHHDVVIARHYKTAITLNNTGAMLLDSSSYVAAADAFKSSLNLVTFLERMRSRCSDCQRRVPSNENEAPEITYQINLELQTAYQSLSRCQESGRNGSLQKTCDEDHESNDYFDLTILSEDDNNNEELFQAAHSYPSENTIYAIRLDAVCESYSVNFLLETAVIMLNYSTALRCIAHIDESKQPYFSLENTRYGYDLLKGSLRLLAKATRNQDSVINLVTEQIEEVNFNLQSCHDADNIIISDFWIMERAELVAILVVQGLMLTTLKLGYVEDMSQYYTLLGDLHLGHRRRNGFYPVVSPFDVAAAA